VAYGEGQPRRLALSALLRLCYPQNLITAGSVRGNSAGNTLSRIPLGQLNAVLGAVGRELLDAPDESLRTRYLVLGGTLVAQVELGVRDEAGSGPGSAADAAEAGVLRRHPSLQVFLDEETHSRLDGVYLALGEVVWRLWNNDIWC
jgi:hypothetical protein